jgi:DNA-binding MarR family transcriptional regulator
MPSTVSCRSSRATGGALLQRPWGAQRPHVTAPANRYHAVANARCKDYPPVDYFKTVPSPDPTVTPQRKDATRRTWRFETPETLEREIYLLLQHLSGELIHELATLLRPTGITPEQYHVLRILQDAGADGAPLTAIGERSPAGDPDVTRLLDRLEERGLARRAREGGDRRVVTARITSEGGRLLDTLEGPVEALHARQLGPLGERGLETLRKLLKRAAEVGPV